MTEMGLRYKSSSADENGLIFHRIFTTPGAHPYELVEWEKRDAIIANEKGETVFKQENVEFPKDWSLNASQIVASKYFHGKYNSPERESSLKHLIDRVVNTITDWGIKDSYFTDKESAEIFGLELTHILLNQYAAFNSPVWFNLGTTPKPQSSACFINSIEDSMESILELVKTEGMLFKYGSGSGVNLSKLRSKKEELSTGGFASGPVSFMRGYDAFAGTIKSGGKTRRAAKMVILDADHPDIVDFIDSKAHEEQKAWALIDAGYDGSFTGEAYNSVFFQNANHSVRVSDAFMEAATRNKEWQTHYVTSGKVADTYKARELLDMISQATYVCGDPGLQFKDTLNKWHTCKVSGPINASNPCSEYVFLDDTACNLASINLLKYRDQDGNFKLEEYIHTINILITAQEILVGNSSYPTSQIEKNSHIYRTLGLGYTNLGALLMSLGLPYDSDEGRNYTAGLTSILTGQGYLQSGLIAAVKQPFEGFKANREPMLEVIKMHRDASKQIKNKGVDSQVYEYATTVWDTTLTVGENYGYRNAQVTVLAPTGTISFMMDADTTGIEPDIALVKYKKLVGGGYMTIINQTVPLALKRLKYTKEEIAQIMDYVLENGTVEGAPGFKEKDLPVFDCAFKSPHGTRTIHHMGHVKMMAAAQPFLSGAISKTVNMPEHSTVEEISETYIQAWKMGLKAIAIYRDNSKRLQPLNTGKSTEKSEDKSSDKSSTKSGDKSGTMTSDTSSALKTEKKVVTIREPVRRRLPETRQSKVHKFDIDGHEGYIIAGLYEDGTVGEVFIKMSKQGSTLGGVMDSLAVLISMSLQYGVPLSVLVNKFIHTKFEPSGYTANKDIPTTSSIVDYIFRWLAMEFLPEEERPISMHTVEHDTSDVSPSINPIPENASLEDNTICIYCGAIAFRTGSCYTCPECGNTSGCS